MYEWAGWLLVGCALVRCGVGVNMLGPVDLEFQWMEECSPGQRMQFWVSQRKHNRTARLMDITIDTPVPFDDNLTLELQGSLKKEGGYKPGSFYLQDPACKALTLMLGDMFTDILRAAGVNTCPLPPGSHAARDYYFDNSRYTVPQVYGEYRMDVLITSGEEVILCTRLYYEMKPKI